MNWTYDQSDPALMLFTAAKERFGFACATDAKILELGCAETDFLERLKKQNPGFDLTGLDARMQFDRGAEGITMALGSAMDASLFEPNTFDAIVLLGALEHFGLGFYGDPIDEDGDSQTMRNVYRWLKPGGWVYFDVPFNPTYRVTENRHFRIYDLEAVFIRLIAPTTVGTNRSLVTKAIGFSDCEPRAGQWCEEPTVEKVPYWFCAVLAEKV